MATAAAGKKIPQRAPPCEEFDQPYDIKLVFVQKITFVLRKINKTPLPPKPQFFYSNMHQNRLSAGASPQTPLVELTALPRLYFGGLLLKGGEGRGKGERRRGRREKVKGRGEFVLCHRKKKRVGASGCVWL